MKLSPKILFIVILATAFAAAQTTTPPSGPGSGGPGPRHHMMDMGPGMGPMMGIPGDWWRNSEIAQQLNLTDPQKQQLSQIFSSHRANLITLRGNVENEQGKLRDLLDQDQPQQDQVLAEVAQLQTARNALEKEFTVMALSFRGVLTPDQWKTLRSTAKEHMHFGHHPGGPGGEPAPRSSPQ